MQKIGISSWVIYDDNIEEIIESILNLREVSSDINIFARKKINPVVKKKLKGFQVNNFIDVKSRNIFKEINKKSIYAWKIILSDKIKLDDDDKVDILNCVKFNNEKSCIKYNIIK